MRIAVKYMAQLKQATRLSVEAIEIESPCAPAALAQRLAERHGEPVRRLLLDGQGRLHPAILLFVGDEQVRPQEPHPFREDDVLTILTPMAGG
jgi:molybdopterin converting factor small subunit